MSDEITSISRTTPAHPSLDFTRLREEGIAYIAELAGKVWSDYNLHDPGISTLEVLIYAITDLGYRTQFPVNDLLTSQEANPLKNFHTLAEVAVNCPLTMNDYRKLLRDTEHVRSGWLQMANTSELGQNLKGLYEAYVELDEDPKLGNLNDNSVTTSLDITNSFTGVPSLLELDVEFPAWDLQIAGIDLVDPASFTMDVPDANYLDIPDDPFLLFADIVVNGLLTIPVKIRTVAPVDEIFNIAAYKTLLKTNFKAHTLVIQRYLEKRRLVAGTLEKVESRLHENRNLCEDFLSVNPMSLQELALKLNLEILPGTNLENTLAKIYFEVGQFLAPPMRFKTLGALLKEGHTTDEIFEGPLLDNGFIPDDELERQERRKIVYISDLVQIIMDVDGVTAVKGIGLCNFIYGELTAEIQVHLKKDELEVDGEVVDDYCLNLASPDRFVPQLSVIRSSANFTVPGQLPMQANSAEVKENYEALKALARDEASAMGQRDLEVPEGKWLNLANHPSIQHDFPLTYGIGPDGLGPEESDQRKAQARQMKGYLLFFDDLLAAYLAQLSELRSLFSMEDASVVNQTYFSPAIVQAADVQSLLASYTAYALANGLDPDSPDDFETYLSDTAVAANHDHQVQLGLLLEDTNKFEDRRNRFLDHLLSRFTESFTDYALYLNRAQGNAAPAKLITDKARFLKNYPEVSSERGKGFDYRAINGSGDPDVWDTDNVEGLKKRASYLLGLDNYNRKYISPISYFEVYQDLAGAYRFRLNDEDGNIILSSAGGKTTEALLVDEIQKVVQFGQLPGNYDPQMAMDGTYFFNIVDDSVSPDVIGVRLEFFTTAAERNEAIEFLIDFLQKKDDCFSFHLAENILLRPRQAGDEELLPDETCDDGGCDTKEDIYSFRMNVVLPAWTSQANDPNFRRLVTQTLRLETPAHILLKFYWVDRKQLREFELWYESRLIQLNGNQKQVIESDLSLWLDQTQQSVTDPGMRITDKSSFTNNAQLYSGKAIAAEINFYFARTTQPMENIDGQETLTVASWMLVRAFESGTRSLVNLPASTNQFLGPIGSGFVTTESGRVGFKVYTGAGSPAPEDFEVATDTWHRFVGTYDGSVKRFYIDGELVDESPQTGLIQHISKLVYIGTAHAGNDLSLYGTRACFSDVQVWDKAWDPADVLFDYHNPEVTPLGVSGSLLTHSNLLLQWLATEGRGNTCYDVSKNGLHARFFGTTWIDEQPVIPQTALMSFSTKTLFTPTTEGVLMIPDGGVNNIYNNGSVSLFFKREGSPGGSVPYHNLYCRFNSSTQGVQIYVDNNNQLGVYTTSSPTLLNYTVDLEPHWYRFVFSGTTLEAYVDGVLVDTQTIIPVNAPTATVHNIGAYSNSGRTNGLIDNVKVEVNGEITGWWQNNPVNRRWADLSGNDIAGTVLDNPRTPLTMPRAEQTVTDPFGIELNRLRTLETLNLDGYSHAIVPAHTSLDFPSDLTFEVWLKPITHTSPSSLLLTRGTTSNTRIAMVLNSVGDVWAGLGHYVSSEQSGGIVALGVWSQVVATYVRSTKTWSVYINGSYVSKYIEANPNAAHPGDLYIGRWSYVDLSAVEGELGDIRIYKNKALTASEVSNNFLAQAGKYGL